MAGQVVSRGSPPACLLIRPWDRGCEREAQSASGQVSQYGFLCAKRKLYRPGYALRGMMAGGLQMQVLGVGGLAPRHWISKGALGSVPQCSTH